MSSSNNIWFDEDLSDFDMGDMGAKSSGMDDFLNEDYNAEEEDIFEGHRKTSQSDDLEQDRFKVSSVEDLSGFQRIANTNKLIRESERDLWALEEDDDGEFTLERLYDGDGNPVQA